MKYTALSNNSLHEGEIMFAFLKAKPTPRKSIDDVRAEVQERHDHIGGVIAARFTRGNVSIQEGAFLMDEDLPHGKKQ